MMKPTYSNFPIHQYASLSPVAFLRPYVEHMISVLIFLIIKEETPSHLSFTCSPLLSASQSTLQGLVPARHSIHTLHFYHDPSRSVYIYIYNVYSYILSRLFKGGGGGCHLFLCARKNCEGTGVIRVINCPGGSPKQTKKKWNFSQLDKKCIDRIQTKKYMYLTSTKFKGISI